MSNIEIATPHDFERMMTFLRSMHAENGMAPMSETLVSNALARGLSQDRAVVGVIRDGDKIAASVGLFVGRWWYSEENHLEDLWLYVGENYRRKPFARPLIEFAKKTAATLELPLLMGVLSDERTEGKVRLYQRQLPYKGAIFLWNPPELPADQAA